MYTVLLANFVMNLCTLPSEIVITIVAFSNNVTPLWHALYGTAINIDYCCLAVYTLFANLFAFHKLGVILQSNQVQPMKLTLRQDQNAHFSALQQTWDLKFKQTK
ncbi:unnamed protein product [Bursaphelenchus okinawaensis]|uniref:Uncharacterized protein n=1 Tax=Bursaphelenchus okinawaensis TaxID=465554 RepID=A0A811KYD3_9BILA|nr:unnamed protein product [Bursaphelenchus okinawaensis]CAG9114204.1 unnamed protein product [Bursaphelenchus okinawaensis]